jgi:hypothetical protein
MTLFQTSTRPLFFRAPEHGGDAVHGGGHPANVSPPAEEAIADGLGQDVLGRGQQPGLGEPGTMGLPTGKLREQIEQRAREIWEEEGRPDGRSAEHWLRAEAEIAGGDAGTAMTGTHMFPPQ